MTILILLFLIVVPLLLGLGWFFQKNWTWWFFWTLVCGAELLWLSSEMKYDHYGIIHTLFIVHALPAVSGGVIQALRLLIADKQARREEGAVS